MLHQHCQLMPCTYSTSFSMQMQNKTNSPTTAGRLCLFSPSGSLKKLGVCQEPGQLFVHSASISVWGRRLVNVVRQTHAVTTVKLNQEAGCSHCYARQQAKLLRTGCAAQLCLCWR